MTRACLLCLFALFLSSDFAYSQETAGAQEAAGAQEKDWDDWDAAEDEQLGLQGFIEGAWGSRWQRDPLIQKRQTLGDYRLRLETQWQNDRVSLSLKGEILYDSVLDGLQTEVRNLTLAFSPLENLDIKLGQQVLTWGTGDLLFLNDLFAKSWVSFFAGRDDEYLKRPSSVLRVSWYSDYVNLDLVWMPIFTADEYLRGERFSFFSTLAEAQVAPQPPLHALKPQRNFGNAEWAARLFKTVASSEYALYVFRGYFHQPTALTQNFEATFAALTAIGASLRTNLGVGLVNVEVVYYASRDDRSGKNPYLPNDQIKFLVGYEREAKRNFTIAFQYYLERTLDYSALLENAVNPQLEVDKYRHVVTTRLSYRMHQDKLMLSIFGFYAPGDQDYYIRPTVNYRLDDRWSFAFGANVFAGTRRSTFFAQLEDSSNVYLRTRYSF